MRIRTVVTEFEAKLEPASSTYVGTRGKSEWKLFGDQSRKLKISASQLALPDGTVLQLLVNGNPIGEMTVERGSARYEHESERGEFVPTVYADQILQVLNAGQVVLQGVYYSE